MGRIIDSINAAYAEGRTTISFEFFPAKTEAGVDNLLSRIEDMNYAFQPTFITLTWRSAFTDENLWLRIGSTVQNEFGLDILLHLTCHLPREDLKRILQKARDAGIRNILALRGDPPIGEDKWPSKPGGLKNAVQLVRLIREEHGDYFCVAVAGYSEAHTECWNHCDLPPSDQAIALDLARLKEKVEAGAEYVITQFFYDVDMFLRFKQMCRAEGIKVPILPGYLPIQGYQAFKKFTAWCKTLVPRHILERLESIRDDEDQVKSFGVQEAIRTSRKLLEAAAATGERSLHFYTMNLAQAVGQILEGLGLMPQRTTRLGLNWRRGPGKAGGGGAPNGYASHKSGAAPLEEVRPIFWANRQSSYVMRTSAWGNEYPNGRWGDARSPAYGELSEYYLAFKRPKVDRRRIWGIPQTHQDVYKVFEGFVQGQVETLPWCEQGLDYREISLIQSQIRLLNRYGFLTINSQPKVDGKPSTDPEVGWGPPGGYVYQKAYVEFFCRPTRMQQLLKAFKRYPSLTYHAINAKGEEHLNASPNVVNAVTWGVFPGREIVQPTVVDPVSFVAWKGEAFELWMTQWATAYSEEDDTRHALEIIREIHSTYFLVSVVDNDYSETGDIFAIFKDIINSSMDEAQLRERVHELEAENDSLQGTVQSLKHLQFHAGEEMRRLRDELGRTRALHDANAAQLHELQFQYTLLSRPAAHKPN